MYEKILVATDGSEGAEHAVDAALDIAEEMGAELHALFVVDTTRYGKPALSSTELATEQVAEFGSQQVEAVAESGEARNVDVVVRTCRGRVWEEISDYADESGIGLIVIGSRGKGQITPPRLGRVTTRVVQAADQPTLVV